MGQKFFSTNVFLHYSLMLFVGLFACAHAALADGDSCPVKADFKELKDAQCEDSKACKECKAAVTKNKDKKKEYDNQVDQCQATQKSCVGGQVDSIVHRAVLPFWQWLAFLECESAYANQDVSHNEAQQKAKAAQACYQKIAGQTRAISEPLRKCDREIREACKDFPEAMNEAKKCKYAADQADKKASEDDAKAKAAGDNADKNGDNAKKDGGMPQMPQIPQMPQSQDQPQTPTSAATNTDPSVTSATATNSTESSNLDGGPATGASRVGFGSNGTNTSTATSPSYPGYSSPGSTQAAADHVGENGFGAASGGSTAAMGSYGSTGGGGSASSNGTGASSPAPTGTAAATDAAAPFEVSSGGGGKLGGPKGVKSGGESDSAIDGGAKDTFKADIGATDAGRTLADDGKASSDDESESGFTVFKMVKARYLELKKRGSI